MSQISFTYSKFYLLILFKISTYFDFTKLFHLSTLERRFFSSLKEDLELNLVIKAY